MTNNSESKNSSILKFICDFLPLLVFFVAYKTSYQEQPIIPATIALIITTFVVLIINYAATRRIAAMPLFSSVLLGIFGFLTIFSGNEIFIKIKPTLINLLFAAILLFGYFSKKPLLKTLFGSTFTISDAAWLRLSLRWAWFFVFLAILNEVIWRNFSTDFWVQFKVFGILPLSIIFTFSQIPYILKQQNQ
ncbi:MAG: ispZ [Rickettsiaceae bacterium]|jgi:intracellular septation protein|nr:ispZ [Rickettsiaceae bacterium]